MLMIQGLAQVALTVRDLSRAKNFYQQLGLPFLFEAPNIAFFKLGDVRLMLSTASDPSISSTGTYLYFKTVDLKNAIEQLASQGTTVIEPARMIASLADRDVWLAFIDDGEGNKIGMMEEIMK